MNIKQEIKDHFAQQIFKKLDEAILERQNSIVNSLIDYRFEEDVRHKIVDEFAKKFVNENYTTLLSKVDLEQVTKLLTLALVTKAKEK